MIGEDHPAHKIVEDRIELLRDEFRTYVAQTSDHSLEFPIGKSDLIYITDQFGHKFLDFTSGIGVMNVGYQNPNVINQIKECLNVYTHTMVYGEHMNAYQVAYAKEISKRFPNTELKSWTGAYADRFQPQQVFFVNSGNEAVDLALKMTRKCTGRKPMLAIKNGFHGRGYGAMQVSDRLDYKKGFFVDDQDTAWFDPHMGYPPRVTDQYAGIILELVQGEAGCIPLPKPFVEDITTQVRANGGLVIFDEIQTGYGRTGSFVAQEQFGVVPDITCLGKAGGGGLPFGAVVSSRELFERLQTPALSHVTTFGGNPVVCAAGLGVIFHMQDSLYTHVKEAGDLLGKSVDQLAAQFPNVIRGSRGMGLMQGLVLASEDQAQPFFEKCRDRGLLLHFKLNAGNVLRMSPPLIISLRSIKEAVDVMADVCLDF